MKIFDLFVEPANYTLDAINAVHSRMGVDYAFIYDCSTAGEAKELGIPILSKMGLFERVRFIWRMLQDYDAFIINGYTGSTCLLFILLDVLFFKKPYAIDSDTELRIPGGMLKRLVKKSFLKIVFGRRYAYGFAGGYYDHIALFTYYGMARERVFVNGMVVDNNKYCREYVPEWDKVFHFGYLGRLVPVKQVGKVIMAVKKLTDEGLNIAFDVVGDGELCRELESQTGSYTNIQYFGTKFGEDKIAALHKFDALVLYSNYEPWGLVVNEALASGIPCIVSDRVGARKDLVLGDKPTGMVVPFDDVEALSSAMREMATNRTQWREYSNAALERIKVWNYDMQVKALEDFGCCIKDTDRR